MRPSFLALAGCVAALYAVTFVAGFAVHGTRFFALHFALGLCAIVLTLLTHCIVITYFIIAGKVVRIAVEEGGLDADYIVQTRELKAQTFPFMIAAVLLLLAAAFLGAAATNAPALATLHLVAAVGAAGYNTFTFTVQARTIAASQALSQRVLRAHQQARAARPEPVQSH